MKSSSQWGHLKNIKAGTLMMCLCIHSLFNPSTVNLMSVQWPWLVAKQSSNVTRSDQEDAVSCISGPTINASQHMLTHFKSTKVIYVMGGAVHGDTDFNCFFFPSLSLSLPSCHCILHTLPGVVLLYDSCILQGRPQSSERTVSRASGATFTRTLVCFTPPPPRWQQRCRAVSLYNQ